MSGADWRDALERAREKSREAGFIEEAARARRYAYRVDFTISRELVDVKEFAVSQEPHGCRVSVAFVGTEEAKTRVLDVVERLPSIRRTYRMSHEAARGGDADGQEPERDVD